MKAVEIQWDAPDEIRDSLPTEVELPEEITDPDDDAISDYLSDLTGFFHYGYLVEK